MQKGRMKRGRNRKRAVMVKVEDVKVKVKAVMVTMMMEAVKVKAVMVKVKVKAVMVTTMMEADAVAVRRSSPSQELWGQELIHPEAVTESSEVFQVGGIIKLIHKCNMHRECACKTVAG